MEAEILNTQTYPYLDKPRIPAAQNFDLIDLTDRLKHTKKWFNGELVSMLLLKRPEKQILLTAIHEGSEIRSFQSNDTVTIEIVEGKLFFHSKNKRLAMYPGELITFKEKVNYKIKCKEKTVFLFTINHESLISGYV